MSATIYSAWSGGLVVITAFALWMMPNARGTLAAKLMPVLYPAAVKAGPARLLSGHPLPAFGPGNTNEDRDADGRTSPVSYNTTGDAALADAAHNGQSPVALAKLIPLQRVTLDARSDRVFTSRELSLVANYLARRYHVAQKPVGRLVTAAFQTGHDIGLDPLLLSVMASTQGLMQVMSKIHSDKFEYAGGTDAALCPVVNIQVSALAGGLRLYNGVTGTDDDGYSAKGDGRARPQRVDLRAAAAHAGDHHRRLDCFLDSVHIYD